MPAGTAVTVKLVVALPVSKLVILLVPDDDPASMTKEVGAPLGSLAATDQVNVTVLPLTDPVRPVGKKGTAVCISRLAPTTARLQFATDENTPALLAVKQLHVVVPTDCGADGTGATGAGGTAEVGEEGVPPEQAAVASARPKHTASDLQWILNVDSFSGWICVWRAPADDPLAEPNREPLFSDSAPHRIGFAGMLRPAHRLAQRSNARKCAHAQPQGAFGWR